MIGFCDTPAYRVSATGLRTASIALVVAMAFLQPSRADVITWQDAVAELAAERTRAEACVRMLKEYTGDDKDILKRGELSYSNAKAEVDAVIAGLIVVLALGEAPPALSDLEKRMTQGVKAREAFCAEATNLAPDSSGTKNALVAVLGVVLQPLLDAVVALYKFETEQGLLLRKTIQTQLEATQWSGFADIKA